MTGALALSREARRSALRPDNIDCAITENKVEKVRAYNKQMSEIMAAM